MTAAGFSTAIASIAIVLSVIMAAAWLVWRMTGNSGWIDTIWTFGVGAIGCSSALLSGQTGQRPLVVGLLILVWAVRLGLHIARRTVGIVDDPRYAALARDWGSDARRQMFWLLQKQALVSIPLTASMLLAAWNPQPTLRMQDVLGIAVFLVAICGEAIADEQLRRFRKDLANKNPVCDKGLWRWSRHPNYFFEWLGWLAYPFFAIDFSGSYPWGYVALAGPICMYWLLAHVSGVPPLEAHMLSRHGQNFRNYQLKTSAFFLWPPRIT